MQLKKYLSIALVIVMLFSCMIAAVSCGENEETTDNPTGTAEPAPTQPEQTEENTDKQPVPTEEDTGNITPPPVDPDEGKVEYSVTVKDQNGNTVAGVTVQICIKDGMCLNPFKTDENGEVKTKLEKREDYQTKVLKAPAGYTYEGGYIDFGSETSVDLTLTAECQHVVEKIPAVAATCTTDGSTEGEKCSVCDKILVAPEKIPAAHTPETIPGKDATCKSEGLTEGSKCSVCGATLAEQTVIPVIDHIPGEPATCTKNQTCTMCGKKLADKLGHSYSSVYDTTCSVCSAERKVPEFVAKVFEGLAVGKTPNTFVGYTDTTYRGATVSSVDNTTGQVVIPRLFAGVKLSINGYAGYKSSVTDFGYYIDSDSNSIIKGSSGRPTDEMKEIAGSRARTFSITVDTENLSSGEHTITFVAQFDSGICVDLTTWNITVVEREVTSDKPVANVIIVSGQSNAYGASPITDAVRAEFANKTFNNVYIHYNNINVALDSSSDGGTWKTMFSNNEFEQYRLGIGAQSTTYLGPELGIVDYLTANGYADEAPLYIVKFTAAGTFLNGQWFKGAYDPYGVVEDMGDYLYNQMVEYIDASLAMIPDEYDIRIKSFFWVQGESDAGTPTVAAQYGEYERMLVSAVRSDFIEYAAPEGISFVNYAIAETPEGDITWPYAAEVNNCKKENCGFWYDPEAEEGSELITKEEYRIKNSYLVLADILRSKGTAGDLEGGRPSIDYAHMCGEDMVILGRWMGEGMLYLENLAKAD